MRFDKSTKTVLMYHEETKHHLDRYARSPGYLDWSNQPEPFRSYTGTPGTNLEHPLELDSPEYDTIFHPDSLPSLPLNISFISRLFYDSLALSAWKQAPGSDPWALRVNPSSGNLHPTEAYLICGPIPQLCIEPAIFHYAPQGHYLEQRFTLQPDEWKSIVGDCPANTFFLAFTSIYWREAWKYGERAFRYCNHDIGHALGSVCLAAASSGWYSRLVEGVSDQQIALLLSLDDQEPAESEHAECLLMISPTPASASLSIDAAAINRLLMTKHPGKPNRLSNSHQAWPIIDRVSQATESSGSQDSREAIPVLSREVPSTSKAPARRLFRRRRSAVAMDPSGTISKQSFFNIISRLAAVQGQIPFSLLPWEPLVSLLFFVHRVEDLCSGIYLLVRNQEHLSQIRDHLRAEFVWKKPEGSPRAANFFLLEEGDFRNAAKTISCHQSIASDGVFSLGMLAQFEPVLSERGPWFYRRLHWECGLIGQVLYLEAEAAALSGTGIGCFHDDVLHKFVGLKDRAWQTLYHFTVGKALEDFRLQTLPAYHHLRTE